MGEIMARVPMLLMAALAILIPCLEANIGEFDDYLRDRAMQARRIALQTYHPNPLNVTSELNWHTHLAMERHNGSSKGRGLGEKKKKKGPCTATNPIDQCWRCDANWAQDRFRLATCALGFGKNAKGGLGGKIYVVKDESDEDMINPKPGTLRWGVIQKEPLWIIFERNMVIKLQQELLVASDKTIDGRGATVQIKGGGGITLQYVNNVIIHNLKIRKIKPKPGGEIRESVDRTCIRTESDGDAISLFGATNIWIDHISLADATDGLIDAIMGSTGVTISNCHMTKHNDVMLFGAGEQYAGDRIMQITVAYNHFGNGLIQRMPRCRYGWYHVVNNDYTHWIMYAIGGSSAPVILSQGNRFVAPNQDAAKQITNRVDTPETVWRAWQWQSQNDLMENGAVFVNSGPPIIPAFDKTLMIEPRPGAEAPLLSEHSGVLSCKDGKPC